MENLGKMRTDAFPTVCKFAEGRNAIRSAANLIWLMGIKLWVSTCENATSTQLFWELLSVNCVLWLRCYQFSPTLYRLLSSSSHLHKTINYDEKFETCSWKPDAKSLVTNMLFVALVASVRVFTSAVAAVYSKDCSWNNLNLVNNYWIQFKPPVLKQTSRMFDRRRTANVLATARNSTAAYWPAKAVRTRCKWAVWNLDFRPVWRRLHRARNFERSVCHPKWFFQSTKAGITWNGPYKLPLG